MKHIRPALGLLACALLAGTLAIGMYTTASSTPAWQVQGNYNGYPSFESCTTSANSMYPGYNSDSHCFWRPVPVALSGESASNSVYTYATDACTNQNNAGCSARSTVITPAAASIYTTSGSPVQIDWSCLPQQAVHFWYNQSISYDPFNNPQYNGFWVDKVLTYSGAATLKRGSTTLFSNGSAKGSITENPTANTTYTLTCGSYTLNMDLQVVPSFNAPLTLDLSSNAQSVPPGTSATLIYGIQNLRSGGTCTISGPSGTLLTRTMPASNFGYTGGNQTWTAPTGITSVMAKLWGAGGGRNYWNSNGGGGGYTIGTMPVSAGQQLTLIVGGGGTINGGATFGGGGGSAYYTVGSGGGRTALRNSGGTELMTAGGGGGTGYQYGAGGGGFTGGSAQGSSQTCGAVASASVTVNGATQTAGGGPASGPGNYGSQYSGAGGYGCYYGSGGGGGYYGGGNSSYSGGSGGSGHCDSSLSFCTSIGTGQGSPAQTNDPDYPGGSTGQGINGGSGFVKLLGTFTGSVATPALTQTATYTLSCTVAGVTTQKQTQVQVSNTAPASPTATIDAGAGSGVTKTISLGATVSIVANYAASTGDTLSATAINGQDQTTSVPCASVTPSNATCWLQPDTAKTYSFTPVAAGTYNFYAAVKTVSFPTYQNYASVQVIVTAPAQSTLTLTGTPTSPVAPATTHGKLTWSSTNVQPNSCGLYSQSGGLVASGLAASATDYDTGTINQNLIYYVNCTKSTGGVIQSNTISFSLISAPSGSLGTGTDAFKATPSLVHKNDKTTLSWTTSGMTSCTITATGGTVILGPNAATSDGAHSTQVTVSQSTGYTLSCNDGVHSPVLQSASVRIVPSYQEI